ncbi:hypothetical protein HNY73_000378 [Argiope bruennichi]|uniref:Uncharacterized protein n=1 Tax=Argiope bruennichi TaxID=94029 RepID=A0A8T0FXV7_ARGBR|nr:hypothetical protein HNY73_000378 [Argiope bruennichi]
MLFSRKSVAMYNMYISILFILLALFHFALQDRVTTFVKVLPRALGVELGKRRLSRNVCVEDLEARAMTFVQELPTALGVELDRKLGS